MKIPSLLSRRNLLKAAALAALVPGALAVAPTCQAQAPAVTAPVSRPNILLVLSDDQSARFVGCYGDKVIRTPNVDALAARGVRFDRAYTTAPQCVPSRASMMTGRSVVAIGMTRFSAPLPAEFVTYPELLRAGAGYYTGLCGRDFHLDGSGNLPKATRETFDKYDLRTFDKRVDYLRAFWLGNGNARDRDKVIAQTAEFLDQVPVGRPWFLQVGFSDPHRPFDKSAFSPPQNPATLKLPPFMPDTPALREDLARHYDEVSRVDSDLGRVLKVLDERGQRNNTVVVYMGDNGAALLRGKGTLYELGLRIPLVVSGPGIARGAVSDALISGEDILPTFLDIAGVAVPRNVTGRSFLPILRGQAATPHPYVFAERGAHGSSLPSATNDFDLSRCIISPTHKLIYNATWQLPYSPVDFYGQDFWKEMVKSNADGKLAEPFSAQYFPAQRPMFELYDLKNDPDELVNLIDAPANQELVGQLKAELQQWMILNRDYLPLPIPTGG